MSHGADNFYTSDQVTVQRVTFKNQYQMVVAGNLFVPKNLDLAMVDRVERVTNEESIATARRLAREEGILCGVSCGAAMAAALRLAFDPAFAGKTIVTVLPDSGERYLSGPLYEGLFAEVETMAATPVKP